MTPLNATSAATTASPAAIAAKPRDDREELKAAAKQFEAIFVRQMLAAARSTSFDKDGLFDSQAMGTFRQMQDDKVAQTVADTGALGMATMIEAQLARFLPAAQTSAQAPAQTNPAPKDQ